MTTPSQNPLAKARRVIVKIGSALLVDQASGDIRRAWLDALADDVAALHKRGADVVIVTSGAIAAGRRHLGLAEQKLKLEEKQAAAATGQIRLAHAYQTALARHGITAAQVLLTLDDTEERRRHLNGRATINTLLSLRAVPIINENDTVATAEIQFGDNDRLAARVAQMISADALILFSDIDGLYTADPRKDAAARHLPLVREITSEILAMAGEAPPGYSSGGRVSKLEAARVAVAAGCAMAIAQGTEAHPVSAILKGARCTWFVPREQPLTARKRWIAGSLNPVGSLVIDDGAAAALAGGKSLLPAGVVAVAGSFERGDAVLITRRDGAVVGRGLTAYGSADARRIIGHKSREIEALLGYRGRGEMVHRDDLVLAAPNQGAAHQDAAEIEAE
ncbi:MAG: glutamate 5-kinase [Proteobacteria bacterium]|nr:glutamate 5-kinase [Pseudomonadota bacterium]